MALKVKRLHRSRKIGRSLLASAGVTLLSAPVAFASLSEKFGEAKTLVGNDVAPLVIGGGALIGSGVSLFKGSPQGVAYSVVGAVICYFLLTWVAGTNLLPFE